MKIKSRAYAQNKMLRVSCTRPAAHDVNEIYGIRATTPFAPNIEPSKTIKTRFMTYDKLSVSPCARHLTTGTGALRKYIMGTRDLSPGRAKENVTA